ncbi:MAG: formylmethanofuran dehydrogenase subunit A [Kiloniellales bacterium]
MLRIVNGRVYDPINGIDGEVREICVCDGKIVDQVPREARRIDAQGMAIMPGGIDIHAHIAGPKVALGRKIQPEDHRCDVHMRTAITRSGTGGTVPSTFTTGYRYATMGYTTVMEAAVPPIGARHAHDELLDTPVIDKGLYTVCGSNLLIYKMLQDGREKDLKHVVAWLLNAAKAYTIKLVSPGNDEVWKGARNSQITDIGQTITGFELTPRQVIKALIDAACDLGLPHPAHIHCNNLGHSGNIATTLETMRLAEGRRAHFAHIQFHSYGGRAGHNPTSAAAQIIDTLDRNPGLSADVGQVMFGKATIMTADAPMAYLLRNYSKDKRWVNADTECEGGCGIKPFGYQDHVYTHALQWGIGLELFLLSNDPWRLVLSTDHPNGGSFASYPRLIRLLMDSEFRKQEIAKANRKAMKRTVLLDGLDREYTMQEIAIVTRAGPARLLGLANKGHLGVGADADITIYDEQDDKEAMFAAPRYVFKDGVAFIDNHEFRNDHYGRTLYVAPDYDRAIEADVKAFFDDYYSVQFENYGLHADDMGPREAVAAGLAT